MFFGWVSAKFLMFLNLFYVCHDSKNLEQMSTNPEETIVEPQKELGK